jgi:transposase
MRSRQSHWSQYAEDTQEIRDTPKARDSPALATASERTALEWHPANAVVPRERHRAEVLQLVEGQAGEVCSGEGGLRADPGAPGTGDCSAQCCHGCAAEWSRADRDAAERREWELQCTCSCCGDALSLIGSEASEHLAYCPATLKIIETRRKKYACESCHGEIKRAALPKDVPLAKSMASASLLAFLIVAKFADGLPLYRISRRLERLGIELSDALMSDWLIQCAPLLEEPNRRVIRKVLELLAR